MLFPDVTCFVHAYLARTDGSLPLGALKLQIPQQLGPVKLEFSMDESTVADGGYLQDQGLLSVILQSTDRLGAIKQILHL